jgi:polysaccharide biosynthesis/export protein
MVVTGVSCARQRSNAGRGETFLPRLQRGRERNLLKLGADSPDPGPGGISAHLYEEQEKTLMRWHPSRWLYGLLLAMAASAALAAPPGAMYTVKPGDVLQVSVWKEPELQGPVLIQPDGRFSFPLAGQFDANGKTVAQLQQEIKLRLAHFITDPVVTVTLSQINGNKVYVIGQVQKPGAFVVNPQVDVMQALSMAGGTTPFAALGSIKILRRSNGGNQVALPFNYNDVVHGNDLAQNIILQAGDVVVVP